MTDRAQRPLTLRDVSAACGVSEMTVSRVLRNRGDVSAATRKKVLEAAKTLGYVPNQIAGSLASQHVNLIAVIIPSLSNMVFPEVLTGINQVLEDTPFQPVFGVTDYMRDKEERVLYEMLSWRPSGVIIAGLEHSDAAEAMLRNAGIPVVEIMDTDGRAIDSMVGISHRKAGLDMAQAILKQGYSRIGFMGTSMPRDHRARKRFEGLTEGLAKAGVEIEARDFYSGGSALAKGREMTATMLKENPDLDFLYYSNDMIGAGGLLYLLDEGVDVPGQIGLSGFNGGFEPATCPLGGGCSIQLSHGANTAVLRFKKWFAKPAAYQTFCPLLFFKYSAARQELTARSGSTQVLCWCSF